jgi:hypothetical protein
VRSFWCPPAALSDNQRHVFKLKEADN